jgi:hypothetical protein
MKLHDQVPPEGQSLNRSSTARSSDLRRAWSLATTMLFLSWSGGGLAQNIAPAGSGILGYQGAIDGSPGTLFFHAGQAAFINDGDLDTHVDNWSEGADQGQGVSFVGVVWPSLRYEQITTLNLTMAAFWDGGWFGINGQGPVAGGALTADQLSEPVIQVSTNGGTTWVEVPHTRNYVTQLNGNTVGGGDNRTPPH